MSIPGQFGVSPSGAATYSIPIQVPPGVAGMQPKLSLEYNSQSGNGILGVGWNLSGLSAITRCPMTIATDGIRGSVSYNQDDRFCLDGQRLMLKPGSTAYGAASSEYRTEIDSFSKITALGAAAGSAVNGPESFEVRSKAGVIMYYGATTDSRIEAQGKAIVRVWALNKVTDAVGNAMHMVYEEDNANGDFRIKRIDYGANAAPNAGVQYASFDYESRNDAVALYQLGSLIKTTQRLTAIKSYTNGSLMKEYRAAYVSQPTLPQRSELISVTECGATGACLPSTIFSSLPPSTASPGAAQTSASIGSIGYDNGRAWVDVNGDGLADYCRLEGNQNLVSSSIVCTLATSAGFGATISSGLVDWGYDSGREWVDFNGDGMADYCRRVGGGGYFNSNDRVSCTLSTGVGFGATIMSHPVNWGEDAGRSWVDINGDGRADFCRVINFQFAGMTLPKQMACTLSTGSGFGETILSPGDAGINSTRQWVDFNGDGLPDFCRVIGDGRLACTLSTDLGFGITVYSSAAVDRGYDTGGQQWVDFNGDGLADYCRLIGNTNNVSSHLSCTLSTGAGFGVTITSGVEDWGYTSGRQWVDVNGDGMADFCRRVGNLASRFIPSSARVSCTLSTGIGFASGPIMSGVLDWGYDAGRAWVDTNGDGLPEFCRTTGGAGLVCTSLPVDNRTQMASIRAGLNPVMQVSYATLSSANGIYTKDSGAVYPRANLQIPMQVVSAVASSNGVGGTNTMSYQYGGLKAENATTTVPGSGRGMLGFRWMKSKEEVTGIESYTEYSQAWPTIGAPIKSETRLAGAGNAGLLKRSSTTYQATTGSAPNATVVFPGSSVEESWDLNGVQLPAITSYYEYNPTAYEASDGTQYGDPSRIAVNTSHGGVDIGRKLTVNTYNAAQVSGTNWMLGRLKRASVTSTSDPGSFSGFGAPPPPPAPVTPPVLVVLPSTGAVSEECGVLYGFTANASARGGNGNYQYTWSNTAPNIVAMSASAATASLSRIADGSASISVTVTDSSGKSGTSNSLQITSTSSCTPPPPPPVYCCDGGL